MITLASKLRMCMPDFNNNGIQFVGGRSIGFSGRTTDTSVSLTLTGGLASQPGTGDIVVAIISASNATNYTSTVNTPIGWTSLYTGTSSDRYYVKINVIYKVMGATPDTSLTIPGGTGNNACAGGISLLVFRGVDQASPIATTINTNALANTIKPNPSSLTSNSGNMYIYGGAGASIAGSQTYSSTDGDYFISSGGNGDYDVTSGIGYKLSLGSAYDPAQFGFSTSDSTGYSNIGFILALKKA